MKPTNKQKEVLNCIIKENPKILICSGAKRAGKTLILIIVFLGHIAKYRNMGLSFIIGGATQSSIRRNILDDMEKILCKPLKLNKENAVQIFGNKIYCFDGQNSDSWKKVRGFTSAGAFLNEGTALHDSFVKEVISRCSYRGSRIYIDTNPENPAHSIKKDYIDKDGQKLKNGKINIRVFNFTLFDNEFLDDEYVESVIKSTPSGMFTDRDIYGRWVNAEGIIYDMFNINKHVIDYKEPDNDEGLYYISIDYGTMNPFSAGLWRVCSGKAIRIREFYYDGRKKRVQKTDEEYYKDIEELAGEKIIQSIIIDPSAASFIATIRKHGKFSVRKAKNDVVSGIRCVASYLNSGELLFDKSCTDSIKEFQTYVWDDKSSVDKPIKDNDHAMDDIRYFVYTVLRRIGGDMMC